MNFTKKYTEVKKVKPKNIRGYIRDAALTGLSLKTKMPSATEVFKKPRIQFLYIHHLFEDEVGKFDKLLKELSRYHTFITYSEAVEKILSNNIDRPYVSISSDDGFKNNLKAAEVLDRYNAKCCFFINPDTIGLKGFDEIKYFCKSQLNFPPVEFLDWKDVDHLLKNGHEIGSHTMGHINIAETGMSEVEDNLNKSYQMIQSKCGRADHFAFPYGRFFHFNKSSFDLVFKIGHKSCATAERGCHISDQKIKPSDLFIRRDHVVCDWELNHILYFILENAKSADHQNNFAPYN